MYQPYWRLYAIVQSMFQNIRSDIDRYCRKKKIKCRIVMKNAIQLTPIIDCCLNATCKKNNNTNNNIVKTGEYESVYGINQWYSDFIAKSSSISQMMTLQLSRTITDLLRHLDLTWFSSFQNTNIEIMFYFIFFQTVIGCWFSNATCMVHFTDMTCTHEILLGLLVFT